MSDEKKYKDFTKGPENVAKVIVFALVAIVLITSFALPVLASVGERIGEKENTGVRVSYLDELGWQSIMDEFDTGFIFINPSGLGISGTINGETTSRWILEFTDLDQSYPAVITNIERTPLNLMSYVYVENSRLTLIGANGTSSAYSTVLGSTYDLVIQNPNGDHMLSTSPVYTDSLESVMGFHVSSGYTMVAGTSSAMLYHNNTVSIGEPTVTTDGGDYYTVEGISYGGKTCDYYTASLTVSYSENVLKGTPVGAMVGMIPTLILIGLVLYVARSMGRSDR